MTAQFFPRFLAVAAAVAVVTLTGCSATQAEGPDWTQYPAHALVPADTVVDAPTESEVIERGEEVLAVIREELSDRYGLTAWDERFEGVWQPFEGNGYGGDSLLSAYTAPTWEAPAEIPEADWDDIIDTVAEVADEHGLTPVNSDGETASEWMAHGNFSDELFYIEVVVQDARLNEEELKVAEAQGLLVSGVALSSGGTTVRDLDWKKFTERAKEFEGIELPPATSD